MNWTSVISIVSILLAAYTFLHKNNKEQTTELTTVIVKLEGISEGIADIKAEINGLKNEQKSDHDRLIKVESSLAEAWSHIDRMGNHNE